MISAKGLILAAALTSFGLLSAPCFSQGYMSVSLGTNVQFTYVQMIDAVNGYVMLRTDVTGKVPYEMKTIANQNTLIID